MANNLTQDLDNIYEVINSITGEDPWNILPKEASQPDWPSRLTSLK